MQQPPGGSSSGSGGGRSGDGAAQAGGGGDAAGGGAAAAAAESVTAAAATSQHLLARAQALDALRPRLPSKVKVKLQAVGAAPLVKHTKFKVEPHKHWGYIVSFLRKMLQLRADQSLVCYVRGAFCPGPDQTVGQLYECFELDKELVVNYSLTNAWG